jgi:hypothetical protein
MFVATLDSTHSQGEHFMRILSGLIVLVAGSSLVCAQAPSGQSAAAPPSAAQAAPMDRAAHHEMMQHHMQEMKAQLDSMRAKIADMKTKLAKVKDPAAKQALQADLELWETMAGHMEGMQKMMPPAEHGPGMAMHHEGGTGCCAGMMSHDNKGDDHGMSCCGGGKCMQGKASGPIAPESSAAPAN